MSEEKLHELGILALYTSISTRLQRMLATKGFLLSRKPVYSESLIKPTSNSFGSNIIVNAVILNSKIRCIMYLNLVESFFSKMTKQILRGIRVNTKQELEERIYKYFDEINEDPVVYHWGWNLEDVDSDETVKAQTLVS